ncbi:hypothetical protein J7K43_02535 [Candidatus Calescamantes bacterium]|nr:hypothetical protein [Candidatus Calescamantes bacterium]
MEWVIIAWSIIFSLLVGWFWSSKKRSFAGGFFVSILLSPLISFIIGLLLKPNLEKQEEGKIKDGTMKNVSIVLKL